MIKKVIIGSDHAGFGLKEKIKSYLEKKGIKVKDIGAFSEERCDYPHFAYNVARAVAKKNFPRGILVCKTGIGNSIVANRLSGVRAALCYNAEAARLSREHNDSNVLVLGSHFIPEKEAKQILDIWLNTDFQAGRHSRRLELIKDIEEDIRNKK